MHPEHADYDVVYAQSMFPPVEEFENKRVMIIDTFYPFFAVLQSMKEANLNLKVLSLFGL